MIEHLRFSTNLNFLSGPRIFFPPPETGVPEKENSEKAKTLSINLSRNWNNAGPAGNWKRRDFFFDKNK